MLEATSLSQSSSSLGDLIASLADSVALSLRNISCILPTVEKKEVRYVVLYASTIGRPAYDIIKDVTDLDLEQLRETEMNWRRMAAFLSYLSKHFIEE